jgi:hypothetical protein
MSLFDELRTNPRLRAGLAVVLAILVAYGLLEWRDRQDAGRAEYVRLLTQVARQSQPQQPAVWAQRASEAGDALQRARGELWRNASTGLAQAQVQDWLNGLLRQVAAKSAAVRVSEPELGPETQALTARLPADLQIVKPLRARVEFNSDPAALLTLLAALNDAPHRVVVDGLTVKELKTEMVLTFWFAIDAPAQGSAP